MPRRLSDYSLREHLRLRPFTQAWKTWKYRRMDERYMALKPAHGDLAAIRAEIAGRDVLVTIAFEDPAGLDMHLSLMRKYVVFGRHVVADNSRDAESSRRNAELAARHGALYLRLPENPWTARNDSRSHGIALNWIWLNVLRPAAPRAFGMLDHDLFPVAPTNPFAPLEQHDFYGDLRTAGERWFLWAGFCFFRFDAVAGKRLDFGLDWFIGLDTGGANWEVLYRHFDRTALPLRPVEQFQALPDLPVAAAYFERRGEWIHEVGWPRTQEIRKRKREALAALLGEHLAAGGAQSHSVAP